MLALNNFEIWEAVLSPFSIALCLSPSLSPLSPLFLPLSPHLKGVADRLRGGPRGQHGGRHENSLFGEGGHVPTEEDHEVLLRADHEKVGFAYMLPM